MNLNYTNTGRRLALVHLGGDTPDPTKLKPGSKGFYEYYNPDGKQHNIDWDDGSKLMLIEGVDEFQWIDDERPKFAIRKLHMKVMALAIRGSGPSDWAIYIAPCPETMPSRYITTAQEMADIDKVHDWGQKVTDHKLVAALFPEWASDKRLKYRD